MHQLAFTFAGSVGSPFVTGIVDGCVYGLLAIGIVLIYKSNRIFNFAQTELGGMGAFLTVAAVNGLGPFPKLPLWLAILIGLAAGVLTGLIVERLVIRPLFHAPRATLLVATAGVALALVSIQAVMTGTDVKNILPSIGGPSQFSLFGSLSSNTAYIYGWTQIVTVLALVVVAIAAVVFFRTRYGAAILAVSQEPTAASGVGIKVGRISALTWALAGFLGAVAAIVYQAGGAFIPGKLSGFFNGAAPLVFSFIAAVVGGMTSLPGAFLGGLLLGVVQQFADNLMPASVPGGSLLVVFALLLLVLLFRPTGLLGKET